MTLYGGVYASSIILTPCPYDPIRWGLCFFITEPGFETCFGWDPRHQRRWEQNTSRMQMLRHFDYYDVWMPCRPQDFGFCTGQGPIQYKRWRVNFGFRTGQGPIQEMEGKFLHSGLKTCFHWDPQHLQPVGAGIR